MHHPDAARFHHQMPVIRRHVDAAGRQLLPILGVGDGQGAGAREDGGQHAAVPRGQVQHEQHRGR